jgi:hypothetical protein
MTVLAYGAKEVRALELALGGKASKQAGEQSLALLKRHIRERAERRKAERDAMRPLLDRAQAPLLEVIKGDADAMRSIKALRKMITRRKLKPTWKRPRIKVEPRMVSGSGFWLKAPPYDQPFQSASGAGTATSDINAGTYYLGSGSGNWSAESAGLGMSFFSTEENPQQRVAALVQYDYAWLDASVWYTAHNDASSNIWVWGDSEQNWVLQAGNFFPAWSDGTAWQQTHGSGGDGSEQFGTESLEAFFPAAANSSYFVWVWSEGSCDDAGGNFFGFSFAQQYQKMAVPFVVFGEI